MSTKKQLYRDVLSFWKSQLNWSAKQLQDTLSAIASLSGDGEHAIFASLSCVADVLMRLYFCSHDFYSSLVHDPGVPVAAICQVLYSVALMNIMQAFMNQHQQSTSMPASKQNIVFNSFPCLSIPCHSRSLPCATHS